MSDSLPLIPSAEEFCHALMALQPLPKSYHNILSQHYHAPNRDITATKLSQALGYQKFIAANLHYGTLARKIGDKVNIHPDMALNLLVTFERINGEWHWQMRPELATALEHLGWVEDKKNISNDIESEETEKNQNIIDDIDRIYKDPKIKETEKKRLVETRLGQGEFRRNLVRYWQEKCALTEIDQTEILIASHIKPWAESNNQERLDNYNGLLLNPTIDALFDRGLISFEVSGKIMISPKISQENLLLLGIHKEMKLRKITQEHEKYLQYHRQKYF